ncbi:hypothetical protein [Chamaesiphon sp.]|uniref:hypothetical protein n=1 Tax=Chamaesiphon sp. TaxID=2814140 RepID=UPI0035935F61
MTQSDNDTLEIQSPIVPYEAFGHAANGIEYELTDLITQIHLAADYTGDDAIIHAVQLTGTAHTLQTYLFAHLDELIHQKKMKDYEQKTNQD